MKEETNAFVNCNVDKNVLRYEILKRLNRKSIRHFFQTEYYQHEMFVNALDELVSQKMFRKMIPEEHAENLTVNRLKTLLKSYGLKLSGNKSELIQRVISNIQPSEYVPEIAPDDCYIIRSENGNQEYTRLQHMQERAFCRVFDLAVKQFSLCKLIEANNSIECYRNTQLFFTGVSSSMFSGNKSSESTTYYEIYLSIYNAYKDKILFGVLATIIKLGLSLPQAAKACKIYIESHPEFDLSYLEQKIEYNIRCFYTERDLVNYKLYRLKTYVFLAGLDKDTCPMCGKLDGMSFQIKDAELGVNLPPIHDGCRCTTVPDTIPVEKLKQEKRIARDPVTGKNCYIPANTTYEQWKDETIKRYGYDVFSTNCQEKDNSRKTKENLP